ncbi:MAG: hypothetical protein ACI8PT_004552 [Gammaproteobacteria bacterium]|jgi:hypothetical protein
MTANTAPWKAPVDGLTNAALDALVSGDIPAIHIPCFASSTECDQFVTALNSSAGREADTSPMRLVGSNFSNHHGRDKDAYFQTVSASKANLSALTAASFDPVERLISQLQRIWDGSVTIANEGSPYGEYFAGCVKTRVAGSALHYDFVPDMVSNYSIAEISAQLSWNLYLEMPTQTGETTLFNRRVDPANDRERREPGAKARWENLVKSSTVEGVAQYNFRAQVGELVLFNTRCPHTVTVSSIASHERRTQIGGFAGLTPRRDFILWS